MRCSACQAEIAEGVQSCPKCAAPIVPGDKTVTNMTGHQPRPSSSSGSSEDGRFPPGTHVTGRYRIYGIIGRGGMGEVYRATDLKLNQTVALKFLPQAVADKPGLLDRFHGEVRIARQVSHPNVCRVYDIGEAEGSAFISMEYVDGEDLASLLRRIGRLPPDKAIEIGRKLCAGLAAAHAKGVLHRDLKPANIMIDGRGQVLIMDFGLAALADQVAGAEVRNGTPAYMAPEQLAGKEVSERSDIYALGLVLHEIFTGQRAFHTSDRSTAPSANLVRDLDPLIATAIARCLDPDPARRPQSALALARMLPGGDPLAEALAAGQTPSPELVASSGSAEGLRIPVAVGCLAAVVAGIAAFSWIGQWKEPVNRTPREFAPEVLAAKAREIASRFGYTRRPVDRAFGWFKDVGYSIYARTQPDFAKRWGQVGNNRPPLLYFWYREAPRFLVPAGGGPVFRGNPPPAERGNLEMMLDSEGRLLQFQAWPDATPDEKANRSVDFQVLFSAAGVDPSNLAAAEPAWIPRSAFDARAAWTGTEGSDPVRLEAAAWRGRVIAFERQFPWRVAAPSTDSTFIGVFFVFLPLVASAVAWRNLRLGRGDTRGATRLALFILVCAITNQLLRTHHVPSGSESFVLYSALNDAVLLPAIYWLVYVAFEPYLRRYVPNTLITWSRLLDGRWQDPLVGGDLLAGVAIAMGVAVGLEAIFSGPPPPLLPVVLPVDASGSLAWLTNMILSGFGSTLLFTLLWLLFRIPARRNWLASMLFVGALLASAVPQLGALGLMAFLFPGVIFGVLALILMRLGVLAVAAYMFTMYCGPFGNVPWTTSVSAWYARTSLLAIAAILAVAIYGFRTTLAGRPLWRDDLQRESA
jgi:serine/threonine-protein kinase